MTKFNHGTTTQEKTLASLCQIIYQPSHCTLLSGRVFIFMEHAEGLFQSSTPVDNFYPFRPMPVLSFS